MSIVADTIALVTGPVGAAVAAGIGAVAAVANVVQDYQTFTATQAARNVAIDPDAAQMAIDQPDLEGLIFSLAMAGIAALIAGGTIRAAVNKYREARNAAKDLASFKKLIQETVLDDATREKLIAEATRQYAKSPVVDVKLLKAEFAAIGASFSTEETVSVARILKTFGEEALTKSFLEMEGKKIFKLTPEAIEEVYAGNQSQIEKLKADYLGQGVKSSSRGFTEKGKAFIRPGDSYAAVTESVSHELAHLLQQKYEPRFIGYIKYYQEMQAFQKQREFLRGARASLGEVAFEEAFGKERWLVDAKDEEITKYLRDTPGYKLLPPEPAPLDQGDLERVLNEMLDKEELKRQQFNAITRQLDSR